MRVARVRAGAVPIAPGEPRGLLLDTSGRLLVRDESMGIVSATYTAATSFVPAASATDAIILTGSATKIVRLKRIILCGSVAATPASSTVSVIRRTTAASGGTAVAATISKNVAASAAATAIVSHYTANPTPGTNGGVLRSSLVSWVVQGGLLDRVTFEFGNEWAEPATLVGTGEAFAIQLGAPTLNLCTHTLEWTEATA